MSTSALIMMIAVQATVTITMAYFFRKVIKTPPKSNLEEESS